MTEATALLSPEEVAALVSVSKSTVYRIIARGELAASRIGSGKGVLRIAPHNVEQYSPCHAIRAPQVAFRTHRRRST